MMKILLFTLLLSGIANAQGSNMIEDVIQNYFQGYQKADVGLIKKDFHEDTRLLSVEAGKLERTDLKDWLKNLEDRHQRGDVRVGELTIESIDETKDAAAAKVTIRFKAFEFTDYLSLLKIEGNWMIVGKIYQFKEL